MTPKPCFWHDAIAAARVARLTSVACTACMACMTCIALASCADLTPPGADRAYDAAMASPLPDTWAAHADAAAFRPEWIGFDAGSELRALIDEAFDHQPDIRAAAMRIEQARLQAQLAGAALWPSVTVGGKWSNSVVSSDALSVSGVFATASWEVDLWGVARAGAMAGEAAYRSAEADYVYARASLGAAVAKAWLMNLDATREVSLLRSIDDATQRQRQIVRDRAIVGNASADDLASADARAIAAHEQWLRGCQAREAAQRSLELLLGRYPAARIEVSAPASLSGSGRAAVLPPVPAGVPLDMLSRRPDLVAAQRRFEAAFFGSQQAKAARLPNVSLTAGAGYLDTRASSLMGQLDHLVFPIGAKITWPLFDAGRRDTEYRISTIVQSEAAAGYASSIERAIGEVENALAAEREFGERAALLTARHAALVRASTYAEVQRTFGIGQQYEVLARQIDVAHAEIGATQMQIARLAARVDLHLALGGTFFEETMTGD